MTIKFLGDPHLGKTFKNGVPLARRGERETMQWDDFVSSLMNVTGYTIHCCLGDIFDKNQVPYVVILNVARQYKQAAKKHPDVKYVIIRGNHDASRDLTIRSAYDVLAELLTDIPNIHVLRDSGLLLGDVVFCPWQPVGTATEFVAELSVFKDTIFRTAVGHWDVSGDSDNLIPTKELEKVGVTEAYTGHVHLPHEFERDGVKVTVVGSMQPYAHGEDPQDKLYVTIPLDALESYPRDLTNLCVRIDLTQGQKLEQDINCLQLTVRRADAAEGGMEVTLGDFDMSKLRDEAFDESQVPEPIREAIRARWVG